ncbi:MAG: hypothetical protein JWN04_4269 [Myxococcaceae bacterium]|nr:hypothetical protein [Myxococcaceae bacterium]
MRDLAQAGHLWMLVLKSLNERVRRSRGDRAEATCEKRDVAADPGHVDGGALDRDSQQDRGGKVVGEIGIWRDERGAPLGPRRFPTAITLSSPPTASTISRLRPVS